VHLCCLPNRAKQYTIVFPELIFRAIISSKVNKDIIGRVKAMTSRVITATACGIAATILVAGLSAIMLTGCASNSSLPISNPPGSPVNVTGNWQFTATTTSGEAVPIAAYLTSANGAVSGNAQVQMAFPLYCEPNGCCGGAFAQFNGSLSGTVDAEGNLTLGSAVPNGGPVFTMAGKVSPGTLTNGNFNLTGACAAQGTVAGTEYPALNGTYNGTLTSLVTGQSFAISATFEQSPNLTLGGDFNVTGTAHLTGYPCVTSASTGSGGFLGNNFEVALNAVPGGTLIVSGVLPPDGKALALSYIYVLMGSSCNNDSGLGTLTMQ
jgi:hypothetical protein